MLLAYSMPAVNAVSLGAGSTWLTTDQGAALFDGKPARVARIERASGTPTINVTLASPIGGLRVVGLLGLNLPEGVVVTALGASGVTRRLADGTVACWLVVEAGAATASVNVVVSTMQAVIEIGELVVMPAVVLEHERDWSDDLIDPTESARTLGAQLGSWSKQPYRRLQLNLVPALASEVRGGGLANGMDWMRLRAALAGDARCVAIPRWLDSNGDVDPAELHRSALYGVGRIGAISHIEGNYFASALTAEEVPALSI